LFCFFYFIDLKPRV